MKTILLTLLLLMSGCSNEAERRDVRIKSGYLNKDFFTQEAMAQINNLPHHKAVSSYIARNTNVQFTEEATKKLGSFSNDCINCLSPERLVTPIRISNVPEGTKYKVVGEFQYYRNRFPLGDSRIHYLLLKNIKNEITEISKLSFEYFFIPKKFSNIANKETKDRLKFLKNFNNKGVLTLTYCPASDTNNKQSIIKFIKDFSLEDEIVVTSNTSYCINGSNLIFSTAESYLTSLYYFSEWGLRGNWTTNEKL